jgi:hypothetical protein
VIIAPPIAQKPRRSLEFRPEFNSAFNWLTMGLAYEILGLVLFLGAHVFVTMRGPRAAVVKTCGEWPYKGLFSLISIAGIVLIGYGFGSYRANGPIVIWSPPGWTRHIVEVLMWPACVLVAAAYIPGNIKRAVKHPMLAAVKIWAGYDRMTLKRRSDPGAPPIPVGGATNDIVAIVAGTLIYLALGFVFHPLVIGLPAFGTPALGR